MIEKISQINDFINGLVWGAPAMVCIIGVGILLSFRTGFFQFRKFRYAIKATIGKIFSKEDAGHGAITPFQAVCTALSATVGTGNIAGVAGAIAIGGPGAVFWMWVSALLGMCTKFAEVTLAVHFRERNPQGDRIGGPMYYIKNGLPERWHFLATLYALFAVITVFGTGNATQVNTIVASVNTALLNYDLIDASATGTVALMIGIAVAMIVALVLLGGVKRIGKVAERLVPFMALLYIILSLGVMILNLERVPAVLYSIFYGAFNPQAATGGVVGSMFLCMQKGVGRGIFSNESGLGTSGMAHSVAVDANPQTQGLFGIFEVFVDTILLCTLTALTILCSGVKINYGHIASTELVKISLSPTFGNFGSVLLSVMMCLFAFSSIIGWGVYGKLCSQFLFPKSGNTIFTMIYPPCCILGALFESSFAWRLAAFSNGIMLCINLTALLLLYEKSEVFFKKENLIKNEKGRKHKKYFTKPSSRIDFF